MGDVEFEALKVHFEELPQHFRTAPSNYTLVHAITPLEENKSFLEKVEFGERLCGIAEDESFVLERSTNEDEFKTNWRNSPTWDFLVSRSPRQKEPTEGGSESDNEKYTRRDSGEGEQCQGGSSESDTDHISQEDRQRIMEAERMLTESEGQAVVGQVRRQSRRRRKLPEIPKDKKPLEGVSASIFEELSAATPSWSGQRLPGAEKEEEESPAWSLTPCLVDTFDDQIADPDSGMSTSHSPEENFKQFQQMQDEDTLSPVSPALDTAATRLELLDPTHRGLHRFVPRHRDEIIIDIGDPVYVHVEAEDGWCEGLNLRTGEKGIFPVAHVVDVDYNDFDPAGVEEKKERYLLDYLGSVSCAQKGVEIIVQSVIKMSSKAESNKKTPCILEIGDKGIKMVDKSKPGDGGGGVPSHEYFFNLKNVTFCGFHPKDHRYFGFITKHPSPCIEKYACHVFVSESSTRCVAQAYGRAFRRFYQKFIETAYPTEDIYLE